MDQIQQANPSLRLAKPKSISAEVFNALTHGLAVILSILGLVLLISKGIQTNSVSTLVSYIIYGSSNILLFLASTLYHSLSYTKACTFFQKIDHSAIYLLIAGTYTPYLINVVDGAFGYVFLTIIWVIALSGIVFEVLYLDKFPRLSTILYLSMGWCAVFLIKPLLTNADVNGLLWLLIGGLLYSIGTIFYKQKSKPWMHVIWHVFVVAAAASMFMSIYFYA
ncbi:MAG: hemolysin III family protein [Atopococcus tabaci]|uniref:Hemolysin III family protein n=1 Tax=Atopococcus tabaci TaxID=269774 RepID=A0AA43UC50_9LACT|nr:hemolysin III family protein [Atopococcus tabaci]